ncbi:hypothetical protein OG578_51040 [Streptomyces canus]|nr:hypothetical protein [Streptomyces canus]
MACTGLQIGTAPILGDCGSDSGKAAGRRSGAFVRGAKAAEALDVDSTTFNHAARAIEAAAEIRSATTGHATRTRCAWPVADGETSACITQAARDAIARHSSRLKVYGELTYQRHVNRSDEVKTEAAEIARACADRRGHRQARARRPGRRWRLRSATPTSC